MLGLVGVKSGMTSRSQILSFKTVFRNLLKDGRGWILLIVTGGWFMFFGMRLVFPALVPHFRVTFDLSLTEAGWLLSFLGISYAIGQFPGGILSDRYGERAIMMTSAATAALVIAIVAIAPSTWVLFVGTVLFGLAAAMYSPARYVIISKLYDKSNATAMALVSAGGNLGASILPATAGFIAVAASWRLGVGAAVPLFGLLIGGLWLMLPNPSSKENKESRSMSNNGGPSFREFISDLSKPSILLIATIMICHSFIFQGFTAFYPTYLVDIKGISSGLAATIFSLFFAVGIGTKLIIGPSSDVFGKPLTILVMMSILATTLVLFPFSNQLLIILGLTALMTSLLGIVPVATALLTEELADNVAGSGLGFLRTVYTMTGAVSPVIVGMLADIGSFDYAFFVLGGAALVGAGLSVVILIHPKLLKK